MMNPFHQQQQSNGVTKALTRRFHYRAMTKFMHDSWSLMKLLPGQFLRQQQQRHAGHPSSVSTGWRQVCVDLIQRDNNQVARSLLKWDKEFHLLRYHGFWNYFQQQRSSMLLWQSNTNNLTFGSNNNSQRQHSTTTTTSSSKPSSAVSAKASSPPVAKIPFVITASMKEQLIERLEYSTTEIKKLTPLKATLLIQHEVPAPEMEQRLPQLLTQHEEEQQKQQEQLHQMAQLQKMQEQQERQKQQQKRQEQEHQLLTQKKAQQKIMSASSASPLSASSSSSPSPSNNVVEHIMWYRVVEVTKRQSKHVSSGKEANKPSGGSQIPTKKQSTQQQGDTKRQDNDNDADEEMVVVGMHRTLEQAKDDCSLRQELTRRNDRDFRNTPKLPRYFKVMTPHEYDEMMMIQQQQQQQQKQQQQTSPEIPQSLPAVPNESSK